MGGICVSYPNDIQGRVVFDQYRVESEGLRILARPAPGISRFSGVLIPIRYNPSTNLDGFFSYPLKISLATPILDEFQMAFSAVIT